MAYSTRRELLNLSKEINDDSNDMINPDEIISKITSKIVELQEFADVEEYNAIKTLITGEEWQWLGIRVSLI